MSILEVELRRRDSLFCLERNNNKIIFIRFPIAISLIVMATSSRLVNCTNLE